MSFSQEYDDSSDILYISKIELIGNKFTKDEIIYRELLFKVGEDILKSELQSLISRSKENLLNTTLFNFVTIKYIEDLNKINISIEFQERWYIMPYPILEHADRNFSSFLKNQEWSRIDYGLFLLINNFQGKKETLILRTIFGHHNRYDLYYYKPFIDKNQKLGFGFDIDYSQNHEVAFQIANDELQYLKLTRDYAHKVLKLSNFYTYRPQLNTYHLLNLTYTNVYTNDSVVVLNNDYFFDDRNKISFFTVGYDIDYDKRDSKVYPLVGFRAYLSAVKNGIGILSDKGNFELRSILEKNHQLTDKFFVNTSILGKMNINNSNSFYFSESIGSNNYIRGMEYYVSNGDNYYISKSNLKYEIIPQTSFDIGLIQTKKFSKVHYALYFNLFFDTGYASSEEVINSKLTNEFLYSGGVGIDLVTYYDKVLRIEYSLNKFGGHGIFLHIGAPIIDD
ncbi:MAG: hypothetical protein PF485_05515 [Bacteroidales bacterium]|nr:hypothetical protein [Bacteroidales bacterium]